MDSLPITLTQKRSQVRVLFRPLKSLDMLIERFLASLRFEHSSKLDQLAIEIGSLDTETGK